VRALIGDVVQDIDQQFPVRNFAPIRWFDWNGKLVVVTTGRRQRIAGMATSPRSILWSARYASCIRRFVNACCGICWSARWQ
jgi:hypothetical protein